MPPKKNAPRSTPRTAPAAKPSTSSRGAPRIAPKLGPKPAPSAAPTFEDDLRRTAERRRLHLPPSWHPEPLAELDYGIELSIKREALVDFWQRAQLPGVIEPLVPAPRPRGYRTTSKRRAIGRGSSLTLGFPGDPRGTMQRSALDLPAHSSVYAFLVERLERPPMVALRTAMSWIVVRGEEGGLAVVLNVAFADARVVRAAKQLAETLAATPIGVRSCHLFVDPSRSDYYLEARRADLPVTYKRLFGQSELEVSIDGTRLRFPPTVFSQVNGAMLPLLVAHARALLGATREDTMLDLYCGYGLFALSLGNAAARVVGVDHAGPAIEAAKQNATFLKSNARFLAGKLDAAFLEERLKPSRGEEVVLLDPPRSGTALGMIAELAKREPRRVLHLACGVDEIPREAEAWRRAGYRLERALPLDLFAGTAGLELLLLFTPGAAPPSRPPAGSGTGTREAFPRRDSAKPANMDRPRNRKETDDGHSRNPAQRRTHPHQDGGRHAGGSSGDQRGVLGRGQVRPGGDRPRPGTRGPGRPRHRPDE